VTLKILVIDDHESVLSGTVSALQKQYPEAEISTVQTAQTAQQWLSHTLPDLVVTDLSIPEAAQDIAHTEVGIQLLRTLMQDYPTLNITVQSTYPKALVRLRPAIQSHKGGFTIVDKSLPLQEMLTKVDWALKEVIYTPKEMRNSLELKPEWLKVLKLAFDDGLQDKAIAEQIRVSERTVRHYWTQVQDALGVYPDEGKNIRVQTGIRAREEGLID
jgi:DNA-binding NarL/FixJ family response regulator